MNSESLSDLLITIATNAVLTAGSTHVDYEFWHHNSMDNRATLAFPDLIFKHSFFGWLLTIEARTYVRHESSFVGEA